MNQSKEHVKRSFICFNLESNEKADLEILPSEIPMEVGFSECPADAFHYQIQSISILPIGARVVCALNHMSLQTLIFYPITSDSLDILSAVEFTL